MSMPNAHPSDGITPVAGRIGQLRPRRKHERLKLADGTPCAQPAAEDIQQVIYGNAALRLAGCADGRRIARLLRHNQLVLRQIEHIADRADHARVARHAAAEDDRLFHRQIAHDGRLVIVDHGIAKPQQDIRRGHALLLAVNDIRLGKHGASAGQSRNAPGLLNQAGIILDVQPKAGHLILKKRTRAARAMLVDGKLRRAALPARDEPRALAADLHDAAALRGQQTNALHRGGNIAQAGQFRAGGQQRLAVCACDADCRLFVQVQHLQTVLQVFKRPSLMRLHPQRLDFSIFQQRELDA